MGREDGRRRGLSPLSIQVVEPAIPEHLQRVPSGPDGGREAAFTALRCS